MPPCRPARISKPSPALSIVERGPKRFEGRKLGILVTDGVDAKLLKGLTAAITKEKAIFELIAPKVGGVTASDGTWIEAHQMIDGGPSVLFDAVALCLRRPPRMDDLVKEATARDFVADAFQHCKFIGYDQSALPLLEKAGIADALDEGVIGAAWRRGACRLRGRAWQAARLGTRAIREAGQGLDTGRRITGEARRPCRAS